MLAGRFGTPSVPQIAVAVALISLVPLRANAPTQAEWDTHCKGYAGYRFDSWLLHKVEKDIEVRIPPEGITCEYGFGQDFGGPGQSHGFGQIDFGFERPLRIVDLGTRTLSVRLYRHGRVTKADMCREFTELQERVRKNGGKVPARAKIEVYRKEQSSPKNTDVFLEEFIKIRFNGGVEWEGKAGVRLRGRYCAGRPGS